MLYFEDLVKILNGLPLAKFSPRKTIHTLITDTRKVHAKDGAVFFAITGTRYDGHDFISDAYDKGVRNFVVERSIPLKNIQNVGVVQVKNSISALQKLAAYHRRKFDIPVIGITGSNGKTIVKEWLFQLLSPDYNIVKSPGSYNSQIGVPLSVWQMRNFNQLGIFEAGISMPGEMKCLQGIIQPTIGLFTNIGSAHDAGFSSRLEKIREKALLFGSCEWIVYRADYSDIQNVLNQKYSGFKDLISWSAKGKGDINVKIEADSKVRSTVEIHYKKENLLFRIPFTTEANIENCIHCIVVMLKFGYVENTIQDRLNRIKGISMRLELKEAVNQCYLIDDTYNNDPAGLEMALEFQSQQKFQKKKTLILSDVLQTGEKETSLYEKISESVHNYGISRFIGIGPAISKHKKLFIQNSRFFPDTQSFLEELENIKFEKELILVKGARKFLFERIVSLLEQKVHETVLEINLDALIHNLNFYKSLIKPATKIMVMVKAFAYGSGSAEIAHILQYHRVDYLGVAYPDEGIELRKNGIKLPIMVMKPSRTSFDLLIKHNLEPEIYSLKILQEYAEYLKKTDMPGKAHLKIDTGMHRLGLQPSDLPEAIRSMKSNNQLKIASIFSHLAGADDIAHTDFSHQQANEFKTAAEKISDELAAKPLIHLVNSPGIVRFPEYHFDMVRLGMGLYGVDTTGEVQSELLPISTLKTIITQIKDVPKGETIGYGRRGRADAKMRVGIIAIGYADGFSRAFSNGVGKVKLKGQRAPVVGNVCMDMAMVDITGIDAQVGDEVIIFGADPTITEQAKAIHTIPYEILTNVSTRVKRVFQTT